jgi:hypothetical protein
MSEAKIDVIMQRGLYCAVWKDNGTEYKRPLMTANIDEAMDKLNELVAVLANPVTPKRSTYVYFVRCQNFIKIGIAVDPSDRLSQLQAGNPVTLELVSYIRAREPFERILHRRFAPYRYNREWFILDGKLKEYVLIIAPLKGASVDSEEMRAVEQAWRMNENLEISNLLEIEGVALRQSELAALPIRGGSFPKPSSESP